MPFVNQIHTDKLLSQISAKYSSEQFIADKLFPVLPVMKDTDIYRIYTRNWRLPETRRANRGLARENDFQVTTSSYLLEKHALKDYVSDDDARNYDLNNLRQDTVEELTDKIMLRMEASAAAVMTTTSWSQNVSLAAANAWNANTTVSNPIPIVDTAGITIIRNSGKRPNVMQMNHEAMIAVKNHTSIAERVKYVSADITMNTLKGLFDVQELLVPVAAQDTSAEGLTDVIADIFGDTAFLGYKPARPSPRAPSAGYMFKQNRDLVKRYRVEERESEAIEVNMNYQIKVVASLAAYLIKNVI